MRLLMVRDVWGRMVAAVEATVGGIRPWSGKKVSSEWM
jgi:hypothetical protein